MVNVASWLFFLPRQSRVCTGCVCTGCRAWCRLYMNGEANSSSALHCWFRHSGSIRFTCRLAPVVSTLDTHIEYMHVEICNVKRGANVCFLSDSLGNRWMRRLNQSPLLRWILSIPASMRCFAPSCARKREAKQQGPLKRCFVPVQKGLRLSSVRSCGSRPAARPSDALAGRDRTRPSAVTAPSCQSPWAAHNQAGPRWWSQAETHQRVAKTNLWCFALIPKLWSLKSGFLFPKGE